MSDKQIIINFGLNEINISSFSYIIKNNNQTGIYMVRLWIQWSNTYVYKIGYTNGDLGKRLIELNCEFNCNGKIILLFYGKTININAEREIHKVLKEYTICEHLKNPIKSKSREIYHISAELYDKFKSLLEEKTSGNFFESNYYVINDDDKEYYLLTSDIIDYFYDNDIDYIDNEPHIMLDFDIYEKKLWSCVRTIENYRNKYGIESEINTI
jgi:hypothetical protein